MAVTKLDVYAFALRYLADARLAVITDDVESRYELDSAWPRAVSYVLGLSGWRFALKQAALTPGGTAVNGYSNPYLVPSECILMHAVFRTVGTGTGRECPVDFREQAGVISANYTGVIGRYISDAYLDPAFAPWPEHFAQLVGAYLAFLVAERVTGERGSAGRMSQLFSSLLPAAQKTDAVADNIWLHYQRSGALLTAVRQILTMAPWRFALVDAKISVSSGTPAASFLYAYNQPADWLQTYRLYLVGLNAARREAPFDVRERRGSWSTDVTEFFVRYVSTAGQDATLWTPAFEAVVLAYLDAGIPDADEAQKQQKTAPRWQQLLTAAMAVDAETPDPWLQFQLSGAFARVARTMIDAADWRFALKTMHLTTSSGVGEGGYLYAYTVPTDWSHTRQLYRLAPDGRRMPLDIREHAGWHTDATEFYAEYVSSTLALDPTLWPDAYMRATLRQLQFDEDFEEGPGEEDGEGVKEAQLTAPGWKDSLAATIDGEADAPDPWLEHQLTGAYRRAKQDVLDSGFWRWALTEVQYTAPVDQILDAPPDFVLPFAFLRPTDWMRTHALFVPWDGQDVPINAREFGAVWTTDAPSFVARYLSTTVLDETTWPEPVAKAVLSRLDWITAPPEKAAPLAAAYEKFLNDALMAHARPMDEWLRFQLDGSFRQAVKQMLEKGSWRFAIRTVVLTELSDPLPAELAEGTPSDNYRFRFIRPNDLLRTVNVYFKQGEFAWADEEAIDYRDEGDAYHANYTPITVRYVSRLGFDSSKWSPHFRNAVLAWLQYNEARADPRLAQLAAAKYKAYEQACDEARLMDDQRDVPRMRRPGLFVRARYGRGSLSLEQGWPVSGTF